MVTPGAKRDAVAHARNCHGLSERRACHLIGIARRVARYEPRAADDTGLRQRLRELAAARRRFGYRRLGYLLAREGLKPNHKKLLRLYREEGLKLRRNRCLRPAGFSAGRELSAYSVVLAGYLSCIQYSLMARTASGMW